MSERICMSWRYRLAQRSLRRLFDSYWPTRVHGLERLPERSCIFCCNHPSVIDGLALSLHLPRRLHFLVRADVMALPGLGAGLRALGSITVERGRDALGQAARALAGGHDLVIFPEADPTASLQLAPFHRGVAVLARESGVPIVPLGLVGAESLVRGYARPGGLALYVGKPLQAGPDESVEQLRDRIATAVAELLTGPASPAPRWPWPGFVLVPTSAAGLWLSERLRPR